MPPGRVQPDGEGAGLTALNPRELPRRCSRTLTQCGLSSETGTARSVPFDVHRHARAMTAPTFRVVPIHDRLDRGVPASARGDPGRDREARDRPHALDPQLLATHTNVLYRAARALCRSHHEAEDLVQETFVRVLTRPRLLRRDNELGYLLRALRNTHVTGRRAAARRPLTVPMLETDFAFAPGSPGTGGAREVMSAIAAAPTPYRDAVVAVDLIGLSYEQAARHLQTGIGTITSRLSRGRQHVARALDDQPSK